ncbi:DUF2750 domain-containing protein [Saccharospirillum salsuginis]|uniref:DUF2750 domain-containing protein n=1 Tax=Saccharospirillum salsuginis TaxID=418750 RepID=A0A918K4F0_9GAMM|nr:DUF2750 domain-containing protein [Saccharospirillum salsuginis]GGX43807.1 hypothetical protein GCM10007392_08200 [Saccharospirillum salsuginis]
MSPEDQKALSNLSAEERYDYLLDAIIKNEQVWTLQSVDGVVLMSSDRVECLPIWPHAELAKEWASGDWDDCYPASIDLDSWMSRWLPGMEEDGYSLAMFPSVNEEGIVMTPAELRDQLETED